MKHIRHGKYRLTNYDYSKEGAYFITVRVLDKENVLSKIENNLVCLTQMGQKADRIINLTEN
ncbi:hypothetical protein ACE193_03115 [Bernardetia sp. OM2101]|uniref:hypothetical protein n=1 Tax=Bernardetia sp. OM2101 TaxID=3344876 RepID=UPI0035CF38EF